MMDCTNPGLFSAGPDWLDPGEPRRHEALWQFARGQAEGEGGALRRHVDECRACARLVQQFRRMDGAAREGADVFAVCPSTKDLSDYAGYDFWLVKLLAEGQSHAPTKGEHEQGEHGSCEAHG